MTLTIILVAISILALAIILWVAVRGGGRSGDDISELQRKTPPIDLLAFRNLTDPAEEQYLREHLDGHEFRAVQRQRLRAAIAYLRCVSANAAVLLRLGEAARWSANPEIAEAGLALVDNASRVRLYSAYAQTRFYVALLIPGLPASQTAISDLYEQLRGTASKLGHLQNGSSIQRRAAS